MEAQVMKTYEYDWKVAAIHKLRINVKSLAAEAKIIRQEARRCGACYEMELTLHRRGRLREEARYTHLALAFVRGRPYKSVERKLGCLTPKIDPDKLAAKLARSSVREATKAAQWLNA